MTATYNASLLTPTDRVRDRVGDVDTTQPLVADETIQAYLAQGLSETKTAARVARNIAAIYARRVTTESDHTNSILSDLYKHYSDLANALDSEARLEGPSPAASDQSTSSILVSGTCRGRDDRPYPFADGVGPWGWGGGPYSGW